MIFWTLLALTVLITASVFMENDTGNWDAMPFGAAFVSLLVCSFVSFLILLACGSWIPWNNDVVRDDTHHLKALGNANSTTGRFYFLGGGYIDGKRVLNFISQRDGGAILVEQADAKRSIIFEGASDATVRVKHIDHINGWVVPWPLSSHDEYEFRIPDGSVVESYTLDNK